LPVISQGLPAPQGSAGRSRDAPREFRIELAASDVGRGVDAFDFVLAQVRLFSTSMAGFPSIRQITFPALFVTMRYWTSAMQPWLAPCDRALSGDQRGTLAVADTSPL